MDPVLRSLEQIASDGSVDYDNWPDLSEAVIARVDYIARNEFPPVKVPPALHRATYTNPTILWRPDQSSPEEESTHPCTSAVSSQTSQEDLPLPILDLLSSIKHVIRTSFAKKPPHTVQRLAELSRFPKAHYDTLPSYLRAVERVVSVSSGADIFPLPLSTPLPGAIRGTVNGYGGSMLGDDAIIEDRASDGASLTPITWLNNSAILEDFATTSHRSSRSPNPLQDSTDVPEIDEVPHARGPETLGVEDLGPQKELDIETPMSTGNDPSKAKDLQGNKNGTTTLVKDPDSDTEMETKDTASPGPELETLESKMDIDNDDNGVTRKN